MLFASLLSSASGEEEGCQWALKDLEKHHDEMELAALCRSRFPVAACKVARDSLGALPWTPAKIDAACDRWQNEPGVQAAVRDLKKIELEGSTADKPKSTTPKPLLEVLLAGASEKKSPFKLPELLKPKPPKLPKMPELPEGFGKPLAMASLDESTTAKPSSSTTTEKPSKKKKKHKKKKGILGLWEQSDTETHTMNSWLVPLMATAGVSGMLISVALLVRRVQGRRITLQGAEVELPIVTADAETPE